MYETEIEHVKALIKAATEVDWKRDPGASGDAMKLTQAALNAANALCSLNALPHPIPVMVPKGSGR